MQGAGPESGWEAGMRGARGRGKEAGASGSLHPGCGAEAGRSEELRVVTGPLSEESMPPFSRPERLGRTAASVSAGPTRSPRGRPPTFSPNTQAERFHPAASVPRDLSPTADLFIKKPNQTFFSSLLQADSSPA